MWETTLEYGNKHYYIQATRKWKDGGEYIARVSVTADAKWPQKLSHTVNMVLWLVIIMDSPGKYVPLKTRI